MSSVAAPLAYVDPMQCSQRLKSKRRVKYTQDQLKAAPAASIDELTRSDGSAYRERAFDYYKEPRYW